MSAFEDARDVVARDLVARPWQVAPEGSIWLISGAYRSGGTFTECLAIVLPEQVTGGPTAFAFLPPLGLLDNCVVGPDEITAAKRMVLLYANDPQETYDPDDEAYLVHAKQR